MKTPLRPSVPFTIKGNWSEQAKKLQTKFPKLTDADLEYSGKQDDLLKRIEVRLGKKRKEVVEILTKNQE